MSELGLDSLSSFELKIRIETALDAPIPISKFLQAPSIRELSVMLAGEIDTIRRTEAATLVAGAATDHQGGETTTRQQTPASNLQLGLLRDDAAQMTTDLSKSAMAHYVETVLSEPCTSKALNRVLRKIERRHPLLAMRVDADGQLRGDGAGITLVDEADNDLLDVAKGELARVTYASNNGATTLGLKVHRAIADRASAELLLHEIQQLLAGETLPKALSKGKLMAWLASCRFDQDDAQSQRDRAFWWYSLSTSTAKPVPFSKRSRALVPSVLGRNHGAAGSITTTLPVMTNTAELLCVFAATLRSVTQSSGAVVIGQQTSLRGTLPADAVVGPFEIEQPILVPENGDDHIAMAQLTRTLAAAQGTPQI
ncbi:hypothetical protein GQR58_029894 [Nymphon striatum]|nr:hypothetical protein GQR58_029894 [Nymphon striatum]